MRLGSPNFCICRIYCDKLCISPRSPELKYGYVVVPVCQFDVVLVDVPGNRLVGQLVETVLVYIVADDDGYKSAELALEIKQPC